MMTIGAKIRLLIVGCIAVFAAGCLFPFFILLDIFKFVFGEYYPRLGKSYVMGAWLRFVRFILSDFKLILTGDIDMLEETKEEKCIYIQNHQTELDWIYLCYLLQAYGRESDFSAVMKGSLGKVPIIGYIVQDLNMCLLDRNWQTDKKHFTTFLERLETHPRAECVFLCPEGTTITQSTYERSQKYALKTNRPVFEHVLLPRSTGLSFIISEVRKWEEATGKRIYLYDTTMEFEGYTGEICDGEYTRVIDTNFPDPDNTIWKRVPVNCHMHVKVVPLTSIVSEKTTDMEELNKEVEHWLDEIWKEKEKQLDYFTKHQKFNDEWSVNRKVETFTFPRRLLDSWNWVLLIGGGFVLNCLFIAGIKNIVIYIFHMLQYLF